MSKYEDYVGMDTPDEVKKLMNSANPSISAQIQEITEKDPALNVESWTSAFIETWNFIQYYYNTRGVFPPPLVIDHKKHAPGRNKITNTAVNTIGSINTMWRWYESDDDLKRHTNVTPSYYECRIYHQNFLRMIKEQFGQYVSPLILRLSMQHILAHEMTHFIDMTEMHRDIYYAKSDDEYYEKSEDLYKLVMGKNTAIDISDECETEQTAIEIIMRIAMHDYLNTDVHSLLPRIGHPYDHFMRKKNPVYNEISLFLEMLMREWVDNFKDLSDSERKENTHELLLCIGKLKNIAKKIPKNERRFLIID